MNKQKIKNLYIKILEFGEERFDGFSYKDLINDKSLNLDEKEKLIIDKHFEIAFKNREKVMMGFSDATNNTETIFMLSQWKGGRYNEESKYILGYNAYFNYIDYLELQEARSNAETAKRDARISIYIATITLLVSIAFSFAQIVKPVKIDQKQINDVLEKIKYNSLSPKDLIKEEIQEQMKEYINNN